MTKKYTRKNQRATRSTVRALIPLDTEKIRKQELAKFNRSRTTCASLKDQAAHFETHEAPAFAKWIHTQCNPIITEIQTLREKALALKNTIYLAEDLCDFFPNRTTKECADAAASYIENKQEIPIGFESFFEEVSKQQDTIDEEHCDEDDAARKFFDSLFGDLNDSYDSDEPDPFAPTPQQKKQWAKETHSIKKLYRKIIRKLHPDRAGSSTPEQQELWHAAKHAYDSNDLETLQHIDANCDLLNEKLIRFASVSSIQSGTHFYKQTNAEIRRILRQMKQKPEWGFLSWPARKKKKVLQECTEELQRDHFMVSLDHSSFQRHLDRMRKAPRAPKNKATAQNKNQENFDFF
jgi:hypothetical protein